MWLTDTIVGVLASSNHPLRKIHTSIVSLMLKCLCKPRIKIFFPPKLKGIYSVQTLSTLCIIKTCGCFYVRGQATKAVLYWTQLNRRSLKKCNVFTLVMSNISDSTNFISGCDWHAPSTLQVLLTPKEVKKTDLIWKSLVMIATKGRSSPSKVYSL